MEQLAAGESEGGGEGEEVGDAEAVRLGDGEEELRHSPQDALEVLEETQRQQSRQS